MKGQQVRVLYPPFCTGVYCEKCPLCGREDWEPHISYPFLLLILWPGVLREGNDLHSPVSCSGRGEHAGMELHARQGMKALQSLVVDGQKLLDSMPPLPPPRPPHRKLPKRQEGVVVLAREHVPYATRTARLLGIPEHRQWSLASFVGGKSTRTVKNHSLHELRRTSHSGTMYRKIYPPHSKKRVTNGDQEGCWLGLIPAPNESR
jgi:hypothetical protein